jgi:hypothetical protein
MDVYVCVYSALVLSKESYRLCKRDYETEEEAKDQQRALKPLMNEKKMKKEYGANSEHYEPPRYVTLSQFLVSRSLSAPCIPPPTHSFPNILNSNYSPKTKLRGV